MLTLGCVKVKTATTGGVVGQYITPKEDVSSRGLKSGFSSAFIGDQKARKTKGKTQYLQVWDRQCSYSVWSHCYFTL